MADTDPYYARKPVPDEFIEHVGFTGLDTTEELQNRERKFSTAGGGDIRMFSNPKQGGKTDPFYQRKPVPDALIRDVGYTGLSKEDEFLNRERKYSVGGQDVRKFSSGGKNSYAPKDDPYYNRKMVNKNEIEGVGETGLSNAEAFEIRENKEAMFGPSYDPFKEITGSGHRASVSGPVIAAAAGDARRKSSIAPNHAFAAQQAVNKSGYGGHNLAPIESRKDDDEITPSNSSHGGYSHTGPTTTTTTTTTTATHSFPGNAGGNMQSAVRDETGHATGPTGHTQFYDSATRDLAPHETE